MKRKHSGTSHKLAPAGSNESLMSRRIARNNLLADVKSEGWRWAFDRSKPPISESPRESELALMRAQVSDVVNSHIKNSRPSVATKVTRLLKSIGESSGVISGKWMIFEDARKVSCQDGSLDEQWVRVKQAMVESQLGFTAKITDTAAGSRVMCIYTMSFLQQSDVWRTLDHLHNIGVHPTSWKADIVTYLGLRGDGTPRLEMSWFKPAHRPPEEQEQDRRVSVTELAMVNKFHP